MIDWIDRPYPGPQRMQHIPQFMALKVYNYSDPKESMAEIAVNHEWNKSELDRLGEDKMVTCHVKTQVNRLAMLDLWCDVTRYGFTADYSILKVVFQPIRGMAQAIELAQVWEGSVVGNTPG